MLDITFSLSYIYDERLRRTMVQAKTETFKLEDILLADMAKALSHPARIRILSILNKLNQCVAGEIVDLLPLSQSTVSQHLKELKDAGLIQGEIEAPKIKYCLNQDNWKLAQGMFNKFLNT